MLFKPVCKMKPNDVKLLFTNIQITRVKRTKILGGIVFSVYRGQQIYRKFATCFQDPLPASTGYQI